MAFLYMLSLYAILLFISIFELNQIICDKRSVLSSSDWYWISTKLLIHSPRSGVVVYSSFDGHFLGEFAFQRLFDFNVTVYI